MKATNNPTNTLYKNDTINNYNGIDARSNYSANWIIYSSLDEKNDPAQKKIKENYFDKI